MGLSHIAQLSFFYESTDVSLAPLAVVLVHPTTHSQDIVPFYLPFSAVFARVLRTHDAISKLLLALPVVLLQVPLLQQAPPHPAYIHPIPTIPRLYLCQLVCCLRMHGGRTAALTSM
jgi:hypothetical protein